MALTNICKSYRMSNYLLSSLRNSYRILSTRQKATLVDFDALDDFTTQLMQRKVDKWGNMKIRKQLDITTRQDSIEVQILGDKLREISSHELSLIFEKFMDENDQHKISALVGECTLYKRQISDLTLTNILGNLSGAANIEGIKKVQTLCSITKPEYLEANSHFKNYLAEAVWLKGNTTKAIEIFEEVYHENHFLRRRIRLALKFLICNTVLNQSEAVLVNLVKFTEKLVKEYKDYYPLIYLWQMCFLSEWFSDQKIAQDLIERNEGLCKALVTTVIPYVIYTSLKYHKTDPVYRVLEILLKHDMKLQYSTVLIVLFDYKFRQGDLKSCCEILNWSTKYKTTLPSIQHEKFIKLLLKCSVSEQKPKGRTFKYDLKF